MPKKVFSSSFKSLIFIVFLLQVIVLQTTVKAAPQIEVVSTSSYISPYGYYTVVGEVHNVGDQTALSVEISATFYNDDDAVLGTHIASYGDVALNMLLPDRKSPFSFVFLNTTNALLVDHYSLNVDFTPSDLHFPEKLEITSHSSSIDNGHMLIVGEVENTGDLTASIVKVIATCYDEAGTVVEASYRYLNDNIEANQKAAFQIDIFSENVPLINSYELTAESINYTAIPEFNSYILTILTALVVSISLLLYKRKIIKN